MLCKATVFPTLVIGESKDRLAPNVPSHCAETGGSAIPQHLCKRCDLTPTVGIFPACPPKKNSCTDMTDTHRPDRPPAYPASETPGMIPQVLQVVLGTRMLYARSPSSIFKQSQSRLHVSEQYFSDPLRRRSEAQKATYCGRCSGGCRNSCSTT